MSIFCNLFPRSCAERSEQLDKERRLAEAEQQVHLVRSVVEQGFSAVLICSAELPDLRVIYINPAFAAATGYSGESVVGKPLESLAGLQHVYQRLQAGLPKGARFLEEISSYPTAKGERWGEWRVGPVADKKAGQQTHWLVIFRDITESKRLEREILEISDSGTPADRPGLARWTLPTPGRNRADEPGLTPKARRPFQSRRQSCR